MNPHPLVVTEVRSMHMIVLLLTSSGGPEVSNWFCIHVTCTHYSVDSARETKWNKLARIIPSIPCLYYVLVTWKYFGLVNTVSLEPLQCFITMYSIPIYFFCTLRSNWAQYSDYRGFHYVLDNTSSCQLTSGRDRSTRVNHGPRIACVQTKQIERRVGVAVWRERRLKRHQ